MSVEAYTWALNLAPVPMDPGGRRKGPQPSSSCTLVLLGLANHAGPDGRDAFPSVQTLMRYTRLCERTIRAALDRLEAEGTIRQSDPDVIAAKIKRGDRRPNGYDLCLDRVRDDLSPEEMWDIARSNPFLRPLIEQVLRERGATAAPGSVHGVQPFPSRGATVSERGAAVAPEPSLEPSMNQRGGRRASTAAGPSPASPPPTTCPDHPDGTPQPCRACGHASRAREAWDREHAQARERARSERLRREDAEARRTAAPPPVDLLRSSVRKTRTA